MKRGSLSHTFGNSKLYVSHGCLHNFNLRQQLIIRRLYSVHEANTSTLYNKATSRLLLTLQFWSSGILCHTFCRNNLLLFLGRLHFFDSMQPLHFFRQHAAPFQENLTKPTICEPRSSDNLSGTRSTGRQNLHIILVKRGRDVPVN